MYIQAEHGSSPRVSSVGGRLLLILLLLALGLGAPALGFRLSEYLLPTGPSSTAASAHPSR